MKQSCFLASANRYNERRRRLKIFRWWHYVTNAWCGTKTRSQSYSKFSHHRWFLHDMLDTSLHYKLLPSILQWMSSGHDFHELLYYPLAFEFRWESPTLRLSSAGFSSGNEKFLLRFSRQLRTTTVANHKAQTFTVFTELQHSFQNLI